ATRGTTMRFWTRELAGWLQVGLGLYTFYLCYRLMLDRHLIEASALTIIAVFIFRGGLHLLKVAVAARVCLQTREQVELERARPLTGVLRGRQPGPPLPGRRRA